MGNGEGRGVVRALDRSASRARGALIVATVAVTGGALLGLAAMAGWVPKAPSFSALASLLAPAPKKVAATAPVESLSPGESVVAVPKSSELRHAKRKRPTIIPPGPLPP